MISLSWRQLISQRRQLLGIALAITLSVAFLVITQMTGSTLRNGFEQSVGRNYQHIDLALTLAGDSRAFSPADLAAIEDVPGVSVSQPADSFGLTYAYQGTSSFFSLARTPDAGALKEALVLDRGSWPNATTDIVLVDRVARDARVDVGDTIDAFLPPDSTATTLTVVGIWSGEGHFGGDFIDGFVSDLTWNDVASSVWVSGIYVTLDEGADIEAVEAALSNLSLPAYSVQTRAELVDVEMQDAAVELAMLNTGVTAFALLTIIVASLVVSNTFAILVAQRTRSIALLRCAGATAGQVRRLVLIEALLIGALAGALGVGVAWLGGTALLAIIHALWPPDFLPRTAAMPATAPFIAILAGGLLAVASAWLPSRTAMRIDPLVALRASNTVESPLSPTLRTGLGLVGIFLGGAILVGGMAISWGGNPPIGTLIGIAGGTVSFGGVVLCASTFVPAIARLFGTLTGRIGGVPARVAATNAIRNPRRTTATAIALVIGVTLVAMMMVGAASLRQTLVGNIDSRAPIDFQVSFIDESDRGIREAYITDLTSLDGVAAVATIAVGDTAFIDPATGLETTTSLRVLEPAALDGVWRDSDPLPLASNSVVAPVWLLESLGVEDGASVTMVVAGVQSTVTLVQDPRTDDPTAVPAMIPNGADFEPSVLWIGYERDADANEIVDEIFTLADQHGVLLQSLDVHDYRQSLESALDTMLLIVVGLLAVAIVISLIGVTNTLSLSVLERTRESALLRALGFTRKQLRWSLAVEGLLLAAVGTSIGIVIGIAYGWIGTVTLVGDTFTPALAIPWGRLGMLVIIALGCGLLASVLPARKAAEADPVVALADR